MPEHRATEGAEARASGLGLLRVSHPRERLCKTIQSSFGNDFADTGKGAVRLSSNGPNLDDGIRIKRTVDMGVNPLRILIADLGRNLVAVDDETDHLPWIARVIAVPDGHDIHLAIRAVDESF